MSKIPICSNCGTTGEGYLCNECRRDQDRIDALRYAVFGSTAYGIQDELKLIEGRPTAGKPAIVGEHGKELIIGYDPAIAGGDRSAYTKHRKEPTLNDLIAVDELNEELKGALTSMDRLAMDIQNMALASNTFKRALYNNIPETIERIKQERLNRKWAIRFAVIVVIDILFLYSLIF